MCIDLGLIFYWGTSEWSAQQIQEAYHVSEKLGLIPPCADQTEYNVFHKRRVELEYAPLYSQGLGLTTWSPLASGVLSGKYRQKQVPSGSRLSMPLFQGRKDLLERADKAEALRPIAEKIGCSMSQLALAWCLKNKNVSTVIMGATSKEQMLENLGALEVLDKLTPEIMKEINGLSKYTDESQVDAPIAFRINKLRNPKL